MAILGTEDFDVNDVDPNSIKIAEVILPQKTPSILTCSLYFVFNLFRIVRAIDLSCITSEGEDINTLIFFIGLPFGFTLHYIYTCLVVQYNK